MTRLPLFSAVPVGWRQAVFCLLVVGFVWLQSGCAPLSSSTTDTSELAASEESLREEDTDTACSYFYYLSAKQAEQSLPPRFDEAVEAYEKALVCDRRADSVIKDLARLLLRMGKRHEAAAWLESLVAQRPDNVDARVYLANIYGALGESDKAIAAYQDILRQYPTNSSALLLLGTFQAKDRQYEEAKATFAKLIEADPAAPAGYLYLARLYRELRLFGQAEEYYRQAIEREFGALLAMEAAELYEEEKKWDSAAALYRRIIEENGDNELIHRRLIAIYAEQGQIDQAIALLKSLPAYEEDGQAIDFAIGRLLLKNDRNQEAARHFEEMIGRYPDLESPRTLLALTYYELGDMAKAVAELDMIPADSPGYGEARMILGRILVEQGEYDRAEKILRQAVGAQLEPGVKISTLLAAMYQSQEKHDQAGQVFADALARYPDDAGLLFEYGMYLDKRGDITQAMEVMERILVHTPEDPYVLNYIGYSWAEQGIELEKARQYLEKACELRPEDGYIRDSLGWVLFRLGDVAEAVVELERAVDLVADDPTILEHLADSLVANGQKKKALEVYRQSLEHQENEAGKAGLQRKIDSLEQELAGQ